MVFINKNETKFDFIKDKTIKINYLCRHETRLREEQMRYNHTKIR